VNFSFKQIHIKEISLLICLLIYSGCGVLNSLTEESTIRTISRSPSDSVYVNKNTDTAIIRVEYSLASGHSQAVVGLQIVCNTYGSGFFYAFDTLHDANGIYDFDFLFSDFSLSCHTTGAYDTYVLAPTIMLEGATEKTIAAEKLTFLVDTLVHIDSTALRIDIWPLQALPHPSKPYLILTHRRIDAPDSILMIDYEKEEVINSLIINNDIGFASIEDNGFGVELYLPVNHCCSTLVIGNSTVSNATTGKILIVDAETFEIKDSIDMGYSRIISCASSGRGHIYVSNQTFSIISRNTLVPMSYQTGYRYPIGGARLHTVGTGMEIINIDDGTIPPDMQFIQVNSNADSVLVTNDKQHGDYEMGQQPSRVCRTGGYFVCSTSGAVYTSDQNMEYNGVMGWRSLSDFAFSSHGEIIYAASPYSRKIQFFSYPSLEVVDSLLAKGYPRFMTKSGNQLILISASTSASDDGTPALFLEKLRL